MSVWDEWEDYAAGFYNPTIPTAMHTADSLELLCDPQRFYDTAWEMLRHWESSAVHNLDYMVSGRNSWVGQATCLYSHGASPPATRQAWGQMTSKQQETANAVASKVRKEWEEAHHGRETLFTV